MVLQELLRGGFSPSRPAQAPPTAYEKGKEKESDPPEGEGTDGHHQVRDAMASDDAQQATAEDEAREQLGLYEDGRGVPQSSEDAATWYRRAADQGDAEAQWSLGMLWEAGPGMTHDLEEAKEWYRKAAEQDHEMALCRLGVIYEEGQQEPRDLEAAVRAYTRACFLNSISPSM